MRYIALHHHPTVPLDKRLVGYEGLWTDSATMAATLTSRVPIYLRQHRAYAIPTGRVERRDTDGETAEVWEIHLIDASRSSLIS